MQTVGDFAVRKPNGRWKYLCLAVDGTAREVTMREFIARQAKADNMPFIGGPLRIVDADDSLWDALVDGFLEGLTTRRRRDE